MLHYRPNLARFTWGAFAGYRRVNQQFARCVAVRHSRRFIVVAHGSAGFCLNARARSDVWSAPSFAANSFASMFGITSAKDLDAVVEQQAREVDAATTDGKI